MADRSDHWRNVCVEAHYLMSPSQGEQPNPAEAWRVLDRALAGPLDLSASTSRWQRFTEEEIDAITGALGYQIDNDEGDATTSALHDELVEMRRG